MFCKTTTGIDNKQSGLKNKDENRYVRISGKKKKKEKMVNW